MILFIRPGTRESKSTIASLNTQYLLPQDSNDTIDDQPKPSHRMDRDTMEHRIPTRSVSLRRMTDSILRSLDRMEIDGKVNATIFPKLNKLDEWLQATETTYAENKQMPPEYASAMLRAIRNARQITAKLTKILRKTEAKDNNSLLAVDALHVFTSLRNIITMLEESSQEPYTNEKRHSALEKVRILRETAFDASMLPTQRDKLRWIPSEPKREPLSVSDEIPSK